MFIVEVLVVILLVLSIFILLFTDPHLPRQSFWKFLQIQSMDLQKKIPEINILLDAHTFWYQNSVFYSIVDFNACPRTSKFV